MDFKELIMVRRAVRQYQDRAVPPELIEEIIRDGCEAPSGGNMQPWSFIVITDRDVIKRVSDESKKNILMAIEKNPGLSFAKYKPILEMPEFNVFYGAPCLVYITGHMDVRSLITDCALAASYFMLSAADRGLGTCWIDLGSAIQDKNLRAEIGLGSDHVIGATLALGYPTAVPPRPPRNEPFIHWVGPR
jgi:nitroreductase